MNEITIDKDLVSCCWLYCGACQKYLDNKCTGCKGLNKTPFWCSIRNCCLDKSLENCAQCQEFSNPENCKKYNGFVIKALAYLCGSDRTAATNMIKGKGIEDFAKYMAENKLQRISKLTKNPK